VTVLLAVTTLGAVVWVAARDPGQQGAAPASPPPLERLKLPPGFRISVFAEGVRGARSMARGAKGTIFVGSRTGNGTVHAVIDRNGDGRADEVKAVATGRQPNGVAFRDGALYVAEATRIVRYDGIETALDSPPAPVVVIDGLPTRGGSHTWKYLAFGPDGWLYVPVGAPCNICEDEILAEPKFASILRLRPDGSGVEIFAHGVRNTVGFDWHPETRELWFTDNGRDGMGDDVPHDELNVAPKAGLHFGYPYCHQGDVADPTFGAKRPCSAFVPPAQRMGPHVAAIGMKFYTGSMFPAEFRNAIFIAQHGSWNRSEPIGYRVMVAKVRGREITSFEPFIDGFLQGIRGTPSADRATGDAFARPVDVLGMPDGSLLISDDQGNRIYRVIHVR
jgi:glucose/arabinose dehydrogenase